MRSWRAYVLGVGVLLPLPLHASQLTGDAAKISAAYGADRFSEVDTIEFTFHVTRGTTTIERKWRWDVKRDQVSLETVGRTGLFKYDYNRRQIDKGNQPLSHVVENWFVYDQYWLLFPLRLSYDKAAQITEDGWQTSLMGRGLFKRLTIRYPKGAAAGPGEIYQIYYGPDYRLIEWAFQSAGSKLVMATTWEDYVQQGPILLSLQRRDKVGKFRVWFTDVRVNGKR